jgi:hypothetical protein
VSLVRKKSVASQCMPFLIVMLHLLPEEHAEGYRQKKPNDVREFHGRSIYQSQKVSSEDFLGWSESKGNCDELRSLRLLQSGFLQNSGKACRRLDADAEDA